MKIIDRDLDIMCFISMPRSGTHWFRHIVYHVLNMNTRQNTWSRQATNTPAGPTNKNDWAIHYHGLERDVDKYRATMVNHKKILYLHRDIVHVVFAIIEMAKLPKTKEYVIHLTKVLKSLNYLYYSLEGERQIHYVEYKDIFNIEKLEKAFDFIGYEYDKSRIAEALDIITKSTIRQHHGGLVAREDDDYQKNKDSFMMNFYDVIKHTMHTWTREDLII